MSLSKLLDSALDAVIRINASGRVIGWNPQAEAILGWNRDEALERSLAEMIIPEELREAHHQGMQRYLCTGQHEVLNKRIEVPALHRSGKRLLVELTVIQSADSPQAEFTAFLRDLTEQRETEQRLQQSEEKYSRLFDASNDAIILHDLKGRIRDANLKSTLLTGYSHRELLNMAVLDLHPDHALVKANQAFIDIQSEGEVGLEIDFRRKDGSTFLAEVSLSLFEFGGHSYIQGIVRDISERRMAQKAIITRTRELDAVFALSPDGFALIGKDLRIRLANPAFAHFFGIPEARMVDLPIAELDRVINSKQTSHPDNCSLMSVINSAHYSDASNPSTHTLMLDQPEAHVLRCSFRPLGPDEDEVAGVLYIHDITHQHSIDQDKSEFLSTAAHELRTPMASIHGFSELLMEQDYSPEMVRDIAGMIFEQTHNMTSLVNNMLDLARIEMQAGQNPELVTADIGAWLCELLDRFKLPSDRRVPRLIVADDLPRVAFDPDALRIAIHNLLSNAFKYSPGGGDIEIVAIAGENKTVQISVTDQGMGISEEAQKHVFERFFRVNKNGTIPGTGLGMSLVREIVTEHGGSVHLDSQPDVGTTVTLCLPVAGQRLPDQDLGGSLS